MSGRPRPFRAAAVLARHRPPSGRRQRGVPAAHRRAAGRVGCRGDAAHRALSGSPRREIVDGVQISRAGGRYSVYIWAGLAMVAARIGLGPLRQGAARRGDRHPERHAVHGAAGLRPTGGGAGAPLPSRAVAGGRSGDGQLRLVRRVRLSPRVHRRNQYVTVSLPSARDLTDLLVWIRPDRRGAQRGRPGAGAHADRAAVGNAAGRGAVTTGAAQADRGRTGGGRRTAARGCRTCTWTSWAAAGGNSAWSTTPRCWASPTR